MRFSSAAHMDEICDFHLTMMDIQGGMVLQLEI